MNYVVWFIKINFEVLGASPVHQCSVNPTKPLPQGLSKVIPTIVFSL